MINDQKNRPADWDLDCVPVTLKRIPQWNPCYLPGQKDAKNQVVTTAKRPIGGPKNAFTMKDFAATTASLVHSEDHLQHFGFCITPKDDIVCIDVDHVDGDINDETSLPDQIRMLIKTFKTYVEVSPSGQGLHVYYSTNKDLLAHRKDQDKGTLGFEGSVFLRNQFVTVTGHRHTLSHNDIQPLEASTLERVIFAPTKVRTIQSAPSQRGLHQPKYTLDDVVRWLFAVPPNLSESPLQPALNRVYARFTPPITCPEDYQHWQYMASALHYAAAELNQVDEGEELFVSWSMQGTNDGEQNIRQKYRDCRPKHDGNDLTHLTLAKLAAANRPQWPYPLMIAKNKKLVPSSQPDTNNIHNWSALFKHYDLTLRQNEITKQYIVAAVTHTKEQYFSPKNSTSSYGELAELKSAILYFAQANGMPRAKAAHAGTAAEWWAMETTDTFNPVKEWIDTAPPLTGQDKKISYFQALWETIRLHDHDLPNEELYRAYLKKNLMGVIRAHFYKGTAAGTTGIVILQGSEAAEKSRWVEALLPDHLTDYIVPSQAVLKKGTAKELSLEAGRAQIWLKNEVESFMASGQSHSSSALKSFLTESHDFYRPLFGKEPIKVQRKCIFFGTTNETELQMAGTGNRRLQIIPVKHCNVKELQALPLVKVYQELYQEFLDTPQDQRYLLWNLTEAERDLTNEINDSERKAESTLDISVAEAFDFTAPYSLEPYMGPKGGLTCTKMWLLKDIAAKVQAVHGEMPSFAALKHSLKRLAGTWSGTIKMFQQEGPNWSVEYGMAKYRSNGKVKKSGYILPPLKTDVLPEEPEESMN